MNRLGFKLPEGYGSEELVSDLAGDFPFVVENPATQRFSYYDTFDWRLYKQSLVLQRVDGILSLLQLVDGVELHREEVDRDPDFAWSLTEGELKDQIAPLLEMRALIKLVDLHKHSLVVRIMDFNEKTVARLIHETVWLNNGNEKVPKLNNLWLLPVRGYPRYFNKLAKRFETGGFVATQYHQMYSDLLVSAGYAPGEYSSKLDLQLDADMRTDAAMKVVLRFLLQVMKRNHDGIREDVDTEFLHDYRVAVRRTRSALSQVKGVFSSELTDRFRQEFAALGTLTNSLRDLDVYLLKKPDYMDKLPATLRDDIEPVFDYLQAKRTDAFIQVIDGLDSDEYAKLIDDWEGYLIQPPDQEASDASRSNAKRPIIEVARERIYKRYRSVIELGNRILEGDHTEDEALHALRIECKKLRYLMEFFSSLFPPAKIRLLVDQLKTLQDNLGDFNDLCVQSDYLLALADEYTGATGRSTKEYGNSTKAYVAVGCLVGALNSEKKLVKGAFGETFTTFVSPANQEVFRDLFKRAGATQ